MSAAMIELSDVRFRWHRDAPLVLDIPAFEVRAGEHVFLEGPSGSGKTTLLNLIAGIDSPSEGTLDVGSHSLHEMNREQLTKWRSRHVNQ